MTDPATEPGLNLLPAVIKDPTAAERQRRYRQRKSVTNGHETSRCDADGNGKREADGEATSEASSVVQATLEVTVLCAEQSKITIEFDEEGNAILRQSDWQEDDAVILIRRENLDTFIDKLTDALGIPTFGR
jgi:hypothetical protein